MVNYLLWSFVTHNHSESRCLDDLVTLSEDQHQQQSLQSNKKSEDFSQFQTTKFPFT
jgi:hypothetical protein